MCTARAYCACLVTVSTTGPTSDAGYIPVVIEEASKYLERASDLAMSVRMACVGMGDTACGPRRTDRAIGLIVNVVALRSAMSHDDSHPLVQRPAKPERVSQRLVDAAAQGKPRL